MRALLPLGLLLFTACSLGGRLPGAAAPPPLTHGLSRSVIERSIGAGRVAIDSAARTADGDAMRPYFAADATVDVEGIARRGADAFVDHLRSVSGGEDIHRVQLMPARFQHCTDGAAESGGELLVAMLADTVVTPYSARWIADESGVRLQRLTVGTGAERAARQEVCPSRAVSELNQRRVSIWVLPPYASAVHWNNGNEFQRVLTNAGYGPGHMENMATLSHLYRGTVKEGMTDVGTAGVRVRVLRQLAVEAQSSLQSSRSTIQGLLPTGESHVSLQHTGSFASASVSQEWRRVRIGAGPVMMRSEWRLRETPWEWQPSVSGGPVLRALPAVVQDWKSTDYGMAVDVNYGMPISRFFTVNVLGQYRTMASTEIRTTHVAPPSVSVGGYTVGTSFGLTF